MDALIKAGWTQTNPVHKGAEATFVFEQQGDDGLILEERGDGLWLWVEGTGDRRVFELKPTEASLDRVVTALVGMQKTLTVGTYLQYYGELQKLCPVSIVAWEQFDTGAPSGAPPAAASPAGGGADDPIIFPDSPVKRLSDYIRLMKGLQSGDLPGTLAKFGMDVMSYSAVVTAWSQKIAADPNLAMKMAKMMTG